MHYFINVITYFCMTRELNVHDKGTHCAIYLFPINDFSDPIILRNLCSHMKFSGVNLK